LERKEEKVKLITKTVEVSTLVIDDARAAELLERRDCDDLEIEQLKEYIKLHPHVIQTEQFAMWLPAHKEAVIRLSAKTDGIVQDNDIEEAKRTERRRMTGQD
jgi:hypothetical protein